MMASGASGDGHGCCLRSLTALGFHYDHTGRGWTVILRGWLGPPRVHCGRSGQGRQSRVEKGKATRPRPSGRAGRLVAPAGQVATPASQSRVNALGGKVSLVALRPVVVVRGLIMVMPSSSARVRFSALG